MRLYWYILLRLVLLCLAKIGRVKLLYKVLGFPTGKVTIRTYAFCFWQFVTVV